MTQKCPLNWFRVKMSEVKFRICIVSVPLLSFDLQWRYFKSIWINYFHEITESLLQKKKRYYMMVDTMYTKYISTLHNTLFQLSDYQPRISKFFCNIKPLHYTCILPKYPQCNSSNTWEDFRFDTEALLMVFNVHQSWLSVFISIVIFVLF